MEPVALNFAWQLLAVLQGFAFEQLAFEFHNMSITLSRTFNRMRIFSVVLHKVGILIKFSNKKNSNNSSCLQD